MIVYRHGFTLIELMIVLALVALAVTLAVNTRTLFRETALRAEQDLLYATCLYAHQSAMVTNREQTLNIYESGQQGYECDDTHHHLQHNLAFGVIPGVKGPPSSPGKPLKSAVTFRNECITFHPDGIIDAGTIYLTDQNHEYLYALSSGVGVVSCLRRYRYENGWKLREEK